MKVYSARQAKLRVPNPHDPDAIVDYGLKFKSEVWQANTVYEEGINYIRPSVHNGYEYLVISNGISGAVEPVWPTVKDGTIADGTAEFKTINYQSYLRPDDTLVAGTVWTASDLVPIVSGTFTAEGVAVAKVGPIPAGVGSFSLTLHVVSSAGDEDDRTLLVSVKER